MTITVRSVVAADIDRVWAAWNDPEDIKRWNAASEVQLPAHSIAGEPNYDPAAQNYKHVDLEEPLGCAKSGQQHGACLDKDPGNQRIRGGDLEDVAALEFEKQRHGAIMA